MSEQSQYKNNFILVAIHKVSAQGKGDGREGVYAKAYIYCFSDVILLLKFAQGGKGQVVKYLTYLSISILHMTPYTSFFTGFLITAISQCVRHF